MNETTQQQASVAKTSAPKAAPVRVSTLAVNYHGDGGQHTVNIDATQFASLMGRLRSNDPAIEWPGKTTMVSFSLAENEFLALELAPKTVSPTAFQSLSFGDDLKQDGDFSVSDKLGDFTADATTFVNSTVPGARGPTIYGLSKPNFPHAEAGKRLYYQLRGRGPIGSDGRYHFKIVNGQHP